MEVLDVLTAFLAVISLLLIFSGLSRRSGLGDRLAPTSPSVADEAEEWLKSQE